MIVGIAFLVVVAVYPFFEAWVTGDKREHHVLDRPRNAPTRTAIGAAGVTFYAVLWSGAGTDLIATNFKMSLNQVLSTIQVLLIVAPIAAFFITKRMCLALQRKDREVALHGRESGRIIRLAHGEFVEVHEAVDEFEMYTLSDYKTYRPIAVTPDANGRITFSARMRSAWSKFYFEDRVEPVTLTELEASRHDHAEIEGTH
jgi:ubiquinol-cytochrome c reductase cytochrome b subunit